VQQLAFLFAANSVAGYMTQAARAMPINTSKIRVNAAGIQDPTPENMSFDNQG
jgi:hypothetical protein